MSVTHRSHPMGPKSFSVLSGGRAVSTSCRLWVANRDSLRRVALIPAFRPTATGSPIGLVDNGVAIPHSAAGTRFTLSSLPVDNQDSSDQTSMQPVPRFGHPMGNTFCLREPLHC